MAIQATKRITVPEIAEQLGVGRETVYQLLRRGEIPSIRVLNRPGSPYIVSRFAFERWLQTCGTKITEQP